jgi:hypothetical protein
MKRLKVSWPVSHDRWEYRTRQTAAENQPFHVEQEHSERSISFVDHKSLVAYDEASVSFAR